jgi:hypothetical protein
MPVTHALKPTFQNKLSHFFGHSSRLEKLGCNQSAELQLSRSGSPCNQSANNQPHWEVLLQPLSEASTGCGNGLQLISDAATALA